MQKYTKINLDAVNCRSSKQRGMSLKIDDVLIFAVNHFIDIHTGCVYSKTRTMLMVKTMQLKRKYLLFRNGSYCIDIVCIETNSHSLTHFKAWRHGISIVLSHHRCGFSTCSDHFREIGTRKAYAQMCCTTSLQPKIYDSHRMQFFLF